MTSSLRMRVVEAGARVLHALDKQANGSNPWRWEDEPDQAWYLEQSDAAVDAVLDCLAENGHELLGGVARGEVEVGNTSVWTLIAVLRERGE